MALINCPECTREISDKAASCPHCGLPLEKPILTSSFNCAQCGKECTSKISNCPHCGFCNAKFFELNQPHFKPQHVVSPETESGVTCPKCKTKNSIATGNKGFGLGKAAIGGLLLGPVGLLGGVIGSSKTMITCLKCGNKWSPQNL